ncbi:MAG: bifunctional oligoribonuclease and phosphatase NrnA [Phycisphaerales bacterium]|jgi:phosphoesterase RecJ-like protein|nr:bifunctional oligoribonuclease and phosphatase NrnA [Phycisphaerales bacterium]
MPDSHQQIIDTLARAKRVLVTTHVRPDGDALGSSAALVLGMKQKGVDADVLLLSHLPRKYSFIYDEAGVRHIDVEAGFPPVFSLDAYDALVVVDTGTWSQLPGLKERFEKYRKLKIVIDHHLTQQDWADIKLVDTSAGSCAEIIAELLERWGVQLDSSMATALFVGIVADTGWFMFSSTRPVTLRRAAKLMEAGVDIDRVYQLLYQNERAERIALHTRGLAGMELLDNGRIAVMKIRKSDFADAKAHINDTENLINVPLQIRTVEVSVLISEPLDAGPVRVSLRSKGHLDVAQFAEQFGGGGHARAAGLKFETSLDEAHDKVVSALLAQTAKSPPPPQG